MKTKIVLGLFSVIAFSTAAFAAAQVPGAKITCTMEARGAQGKLDDQGILEGTMKVELIVPPDGQELSTIRFTEEVVGQKAKVLVEVKNALCEMSIDERVAICSGGGIDVRIDTKSFISDGQAYTNSARVFAARSSTLSAAFQKGLNSVFFPQKDDFQMAELGSNICEFEKLGVPSKSKKTM